MSRKKYSDLTQYEKNQKTEEFIRKANIKHNFKYDYSKVVYINAITKVIVICKKHNIEFLQAPSDHLRGNGGCVKCQIENTIKLQTYDTDTFIKHAQLVHGNKYDYIKVLYINSKTKVIIICPIHGEFLQNPSMHLHGCGCPKCGINASILIRRKNKKHFTDKAEICHNYFYDYSYFDYINSYTKGKIMCPIHGEFYMTPSCHLSGNGCPKCKYELIGNVLRFDTQYVINKANKVHNYKYDYSKLIYVDMRCKVIIICPIHGEFTQLINNHLRGYGCPKCKNSHGENIVESYLKDLNVKYETQKNLMDVNIKVI